MDSFRNLEDETFPSFLSNASLGSSGCATLANVTLGSALGVPVAASTVAKIRATADNRFTDVQASYLDDGPLSLGSRGSNCEREKFALSFKDDLDDAGDFIAANRFSDLLVKVHLDESECVPRPNASAAVKVTPAPARHSDYPDDISTGLLTFSHIGNKESMAAQAATLPVMMEEESSESEAANSDGLSGSVASFLANEKLMSIDSMNSDVTDDDIDMDHLHDEELKLYFNKLVPPSMQRGQVEGQEIPATVSYCHILAIAQSCLSVINNKHHGFLFLWDRFSQGDFSMSDVRLAATGMDSCPASDEEDTEDELEASQNRSRARFLLPSTSRQLVGESHRPHFRPGLEGGSSDDEHQPGTQFSVSRASLEQRRSAEGQVIDCPITGDGGGGDGSSGSEENGNDGGVSTIPPPASIQTTYDVLRGLGIVGGSGTGEDVRQLLSQLPGLDRPGVIVHNQVMNVKMGDRVGPVGTGETEPSAQSFEPGGLSTVSWNMNQDREVTLNAMDSSHSGVVSPEEHINSMYLRADAGCHYQDSVASNLQGAQNSFQFSFLKETVEPDLSLGFRGGPCGNSISLEQQPTSSGERSGESLEAKYLSQNCHQNNDEHSDVWNHRPDDVELEFQGANATHSIVYQNEEGKWVTDLAYYSSFEKEMEAKVPKNNTVEMHSEDFIGGSQAMERIIEDQNEFEKEHQFMQEEKIEPANGSIVLEDTSWKIPSSNNILMRASQVSTEFDRGNHSYLRISLGEFFQQRSEALGCLGSMEENYIKRPSFGYVINSPEKREPFALIRPSDFSSRGSSIHSDTVQLSDADETMNPEDLEKTLEPATAELPAKSQAHPETNGKDIRVIVFGPVSPILSVEEEENSCHSSESPNSNPSLSISTISSAIKDASLSSDPAQLAAMMMELFKKSRSKSSQRQGGSVPDPKQIPGQANFQDALQKTSSLADLSLDMEKYLKKAEVSSSDSDASSSQSCVDILSLADNLANSHRLTKASNLQKEISLHTEGHTVSQQTQVEKKSIAPISYDTNSETEAKKSDVKRSAIPRPKNSCLPMATAYPARRSVGATQSSTSLSFKPKSTESCSGSGRSKSECHTAATRNGGCLESKVKMGTAQPQMSASAATKTSPSFRRSGCSDLPLQRTSPHRLQSKNCLRQTDIEELNSLPSPQASQAVGKEKEMIVRQNSATTLNKFGKFLFSSPERSAPHVVDATHYSFRPSTSPLTHSSPSQTTLPSVYGEMTPPSSSGGVNEMSPGTHPLSPQSHCSSPSLSRLTYLSINENTVMPTPDHHKQNKSMALSTTIIRASPTPPVEPIDANESVGQSRNSVTVGSSNISQTLCHAVTPDLTHKASEVGLCSQSKCDQGKGHSEPGPRLYTQGDSGFSSNLNIQHQPGAGLEQNTQVSSVSGTGSEAFCGSRYGIPSSSVCKAGDLRYGLAPNYNAQGILSDLAVGGPSLLNGRSLFNTQLPQQYLNSEGPLQPSTYSLGTLAAPYSVPTMIAGANPQMGPAYVHQQTSMSSGYMNGGQHQYPLGKPYGQPTLGMWSARDLTDLRTQVVVPDELKFPSSCCVGIACQTSLSIFNPSERWQQVAISVVNLSIDGQKPCVEVDSLPYQWLIVKNKTIIGPKSTEEQKVLLIAFRAGLYQCTLSVSSWPASAESETVAQAEVFAKKVVLVAVAENPAIEVDVGKTGCLDFGDLAGGSVKALPLKLVNRTRATVPIRLVISANASAWHCFSFSKSPVAMTADGSFHSGGSLMPVSAQSVINHVLHSNYGDNPDSFMVWVHFNAPQRFSSCSGELSPPDEYSARVDIEVDSPGPSHVIQSVALKARSGTARVHAPKDLQAVCLQTTLGEYAKQTLPLRNAGNIDVLLRLKSNDSDDCFTVKPEELLLRTGEEKNVIVTFTAQGSQKYRESVLTILVLPSGPQYEVVLKGEVVQGNSRNVSSAKGSVLYGEVPPILSNKQFMAWGGVTLGRAVQQRLVLRNNSPTSSQQLRLLIRGQDQDCFQLQSSFGPDERLTRNRELLIKPKENVAVHLLFAPTRVASMLATLEIKQSAVQTSQPGVKFTIPLSGYGGTSNVILEDLRKRSDGYVATLSGVQAGRVSKLCVCVRNTGSRAAFVRAVPYSDLEKRTVMESTVISLSPSQFVLKERTQEVITVVMKASRREQALCQSHTALLATVCLFCGDEVSRQQFRKLLRIKPEAGKKVLSENSLLKNISFDEPFLGEELVQESYDLPQRPNEGQIFYGNVNKVILSLLGTVEVSDSGESDHVDFVRPSQHHAPDSDSGLGTSERHFSNVSLDVLPVKGPPLSISEPVLKQAEPPVGDTWSIQPEQLVLTAPTINGAADPWHVKIINRSNRELSFELSWPAHCLTVTPQHGVIEPQSHLKILISPNPSLATKTSLLPWTGQIYVQCDNQQKFIRVQIRQDLAMDVSTAGPSSDQSLCTLSPKAATPTGPGLKAQGGSPQHPVIIKNRTLVFPSTLSGESSECCLEVENSGEEVRWYLSSFAPPYVKGVDGSGAVYRATYSAFRCERVSGMLGVKEKMKVPITFIPRDGGDYAQFWDLECHTVSKPQHKSCLRFQLCGTGIKTGVELPCADDRTLVQTEPTVKSKKRTGSVGSKTAEPSRTGVYAPQSLYTFPATRVGEVSTLKVNFRNNSPSTHELRFLSPTEPFYIKHSKYSLRAQHYINLPVQFKPVAVGQFSGLLLVQTDTDVKHTVTLAGEALP
ncbi:hypothetical protein NFI96_019814 [Prochilodus magdalenae]|nr:hypothetical protein NFI96_019814 [Prochilodus magdalenae]